MVNYLGILKNPQIKYEVFLEVMRDFNMGGISIKNYDKVIDFIKKLPIVPTLNPIQEIELKKLNLTNISDDQKQVIINEILNRSIANSKKCWHPNANIKTCDVDNSGKLKVSAAHSIQNNGILNKIAEKGQVSTFSLNKGSFTGKVKGKKLASIFWGFCNTHDAIFKEIEITPYLKTKKQNFLFAYRAFIVAAHKKTEGSYCYNFGEQYKNDIAETKEIFDKAILNDDFDIIETEVIELTAFYPIAVSSHFYLDYDFEGNLIQHSENRMEHIYISVFPVNNKTYFLLSYLKTDEFLYGNLGRQLRARNNLKSDISMLIAGHSENVYFNPIYYKTFIQQHENSVHQLLKETQFDYTEFDNNGQPLTVTSLTPQDYLSNNYEINFFGY